MKLGFLAAALLTFQFQPLNAQGVSPLEQKEPAWLPPLASSGAPGCRCIAVPPYSGRSSGLLDPDFIEQAGGDGVCAQVAKLVPATH